MNELEKLFHRLAPGSSIDDPAEMFAIIRREFGKAGRSLTFSELADMVGVKDERSMRRHAQNEGSNARPLPRQVAEELRAHILNKLGELPEWSSDGAILHHNIYPRFMAYHEGGTVERVVWSSLLPAGNIRTYGRAWEHLAEDVLRTL